jgi:hypothetical protein
MKSLQRIELLKDLVQQAVDRGATSVEAVHQQIAALPFEMLEKSGLLDDGKLKLKEKQQRTIGTVYDAIRRINRQIGELISDQFELLEDSEHIRKVLDEKAAAKAPRSAAKKASSAAKKKRTGARKAGK